MEEPEKALGVRLDDGNRNLLEGFCDSTPYLNHFGKLS